MKKSVDEIICSIQEADLPGYLGLDKITLHSKDTLGDTPLHIVTIWGEIDSVKALVDAGAEIDAIGEYGMTPLYEAISRDNAEIVDFLLSRGANPYLDSEFGNGFRIASNKEKSSKILNEYKLKNHPKI